MLDGKKRRLASAGSAVSCNISDQNLLLAVRSNSQPNSCKLSPLCPAPHRPGAPDLSETIRTRASKLPKYGDQRTALVAGTLYPSADRQ